MASEKVSLTVRGQQYEGWKTIRIQRSMRAIAASFSISLTDNWTYNSDPWILIPGDECEVKTNGETVLKGYIDTVESSYTARERSISVSGREKTADLVDCSIDYKGQTSITKISLYALAQKLARPFGILVKNESGNAKLIESVSINPGDSVFSVLEKNARSLGVLLASDGKGTLLLQKVAGSSTIGFAAARFIQGENILGASSSFSTKDRFSEYRVISQTNFEGLDPALLPAVIGKSKDGDVSRYRLLVVNAESASSPEAASARAKWEMSHRRGQSTSVSIKTQGWRLADGSLFDVNKLYKIDSPWIGLDDELLLEDISFDSGLQGTTADLKFTRKDAYLAEPPQEAKEDLLKKLVRDNS